jgi:4-amino-4-deoxy-L-arabinose transferase-like glycosyltransferase
MQMTSPWRKRAAVLLGGLTAIRLVMLATIGVANGEAYYAMWGRFPSWSYYDHPPLVAWMTWLFTLPSHSDFAVRLAPVVCATAFGALIYRLGERLFSPRAGFLALALVTCLPAFFVTAIVINPEAPLAPLWVLALLQVEGMRGRAEAWRPIAAGAAIGLAFLAKYTGLLLVPAALLYFAASREHRYWLKRPSFYLGALTALAVASPVVLWNLEHHWPSLTLHFVERAAPVDGGSVAHGLLAVLEGQFAAFNPLLFPLLGLFVFVALRRARGDDRYRFLVWMSVPVLLFLMVAMLRVRDPEAHWTMVGFMSVCVAGAGWLDERLAQGLVSRGFRVYAAVSAAFTFIVIGVGYVHARGAWLMGLVPERLYDPNVDATTELFGWDRVSQAIRENAAALGPSASVASCQYALCAQLLRQLDDAPSVYCPSARRTQFDFIGRRDPPPGAPVLYVNDDHYPESPLGLMPRRDCQLTRTVPVERGGRLVRHYRLYACSPEAPDRIPPGTITLDAR